MQEKNFFWGNIQKSLSYFVAGVTLIFSAPLQKLGTTLNVTYVGTDKVVLALLNNDGSSVNTENVSVMMPNNTTRDTSGGATGEVIISHSVTTMPDNVF